MGKLADFDANAVLAFAESTVVKRRQLEVDDLAAGAQWAVLHAADPTAEPAGRACARRGGPRLVQVGGDGTPWVQDLCLAELAISRQTHVHATRFLVADALDLIHRLPGCWAVVQGLACEVWVARKLARATRHLSVSETAQVDAGVATALAGEQPGRFFTILEAKIIEANPEAWAARIDADRARRYVSVGRVDETGLRHVIARVEHGDAVWVDALLNRIADILALQDETAGAPARGRDLLRSEAFGWLARPAELLALLLEHAGDPDQSPYGADRDAGSQGDAGTGHTGDPDQSPYRVDRDRDSPEYAHTGDRSGDPSDEHTNGKPEGQPDGRQDGKPSGPPAGRPEGRRDRHPEGQPDRNPEESPDTGWLRGFPARLLDTLKSIDPAKLRPQAVVYAHLHESALTTGTGVVRVEDGGGPRLVEHLADLLGHAQITVKPVIDLNDRISSNAYEHPEWLRERIHLTTPADPFPHATRISRHGDIDHCVPYRHDIPGRPAPPGQSGTHNAAPLGRYHHRVKTYLNYTVRQPRPGTHVWRTPHNRWLLVDERGTHRIDESLGHALTGRSQGEQHLALIIRDQNPGYGEVVGTQRGRSSSRSEDQR